MMAICSGLSGFPSLGGGHPRIFVRLGDPPNQLAFTRFTGDHRAAAVSAGQSGRARIEPQSDSSYRCRGTFGSA